MLMGVSLAIWVWLCAQSGLRSVTFEESGEMFVKVCFLLLLLFCCLFVCFFKDRSHYLALVVLELIK